MHALGLPTTPEMLSSCDKVLAAPRDLIAAAAVFATKQNPLIAHFAEQLDERTIKLREKISALAITVQLFERRGLLKGEKGIEQLGDIESNVNDGEVLEHHLQVARDEQLSIEESEQLLELSSHDFTFMSEASEAANPHIELWKVAVMWKEGKAEWMLTPFAKSFAKPGTAKRRIVKWVGALKKLAEIFRRRQLIGPTNIVD